MANKHMKRCSTSLGKTEGKRRRGRQRMNNAINEIKNTLEATNSRIIEAEDRISELEDRMVEINESERIKEKRIKRNEVLYMGTLLHCWWECKLVQPLWRTVWRL